MSPSSQPATWAFLLQYPPDQLVVLQLPEEDGEPPAIHLAIRMPRNISPDDVLIRNGWLMAGRWRQRSYGFVVRVTPTTET